MMVENTETPRKINDTAPPPKIMDLKRSRGGLTDDVLNSGSLEEARYKLTKIKCIRDDIRSAELLFMEYQAKLKFGYEEEAKSFLNDVLKQPENKDFMYHVIYYLTLEYQRLGYEEVSMFRNTLMAYDFERQRELFQTVISKHPSFTCELLLTLLSIVNEAAKRTLNPHEAAPMIILQNRLIAYIMKNEACTKKVRGFWNLGQSLITTQFHDMDDRKIQFVYDLFIKSCLQECYSKSEADTKENRATCNTTMQKYIQKFGALAFFVKIMQKIDSTKLIPTSFETFSIAHELSGCIPSTWSPAMRPYLLFFLTGARIQLPSINPDKLYLPYRRLMNPVPTEVVQKMEESAFRDSFNGLSTLHLKLQKFKETDEVIQFVDPQLYFFITFGHYYSERYTEVPKMEEYFPNDDLQYKIIRFCADLFTGNKPARMLAELAKVSLENGYTTYDPEFTMEFCAGAQKRRHAILPKENLGQWLLFIAPQALDLCDKDDEIFLIAQLIISQFELDRFGKERLAYAYENIKDKASLKSVNLDKYIIKDALFHRFVILSQKFESPWNPKECYQNKPKSISEQELLKLLLTFLRDDSRLA